MDVSVAQDQLKRRVLFTPLRTMESLHNWIKVFLDVDLPMEVVADEGPNPSNCSPMLMVWRIYEACLNNKTGEMSRVMAYASRDSFKTLAASILEILAVLHLDRDVGHMAAIEAQSMNAQAYVKAFFDREYLRDFKVGDAKEQTTIVRYYDGSTGASVPEKEWAALEPGEQVRYRRIQRYIKIVICTMRGANSLHVPFLVVDEVDVVQDPKAYKQSRFIPSNRDGKEPITLLTSTRKTGTGLVQAELDTAEKTGLVVWHWNILDVTEACPTSRHRPDLPKLSIYRSDETLQSLSEDQWGSLPDDEQKKYARDEDCFSGCLKNCKIYSICRGKLATKQKRSAAETGTLRTITNTQNRFVENSADENLLKAEMLCWRPSTENLIYPRLNPEIHKLTAAQIAFKILGEQVHGNYTKQHLYALCIQRDMQFYVGMDWGMTHNYVIVVGVRDGARMFILDCWSVGDMDHSQKIDFCTRRIKHLKPIVFADPEDLAAIKQFKRSGFAMRDWQKGKGSVIGGIEAVRMKLWPVMGREPQLYFIKGDPGVDFLFEKLTKWHWLEDKAGRLTDEPSDVGKDEPDALRYMVMNVFAPGGKLVIPREEERTTAPVLIQPQYTAENWMRQVISEHTGNGLVTEEIVSDVPNVGKKGNFVWDLG
jgi:hypothetical protein